MQLQPSAPGEYGQGYGQDITDPAAFGSFILLNNGRYFSLRRPQTAIAHADAWTIAWALSHICRFTGHCSAFYSVAEHSVRASLIVPKHLALQALLHDATEAFIGDVSTPLKAMLHEYRLIEQEIESLVMHRFGLPSKADRAIKDADLVMLATERRDLMNFEADSIALRRSPVCANAWACLDDVIPLEQTIEPWSPSQARAEFIARYIELGGCEKLALPARCPYRNIEQARKAAHAFSVRAKLERDISLQMLTEMQETSESNDSAPLISDTTEVHGAHRTPQASGPDSHPTRLSPILRGL